MLADMMWEKLIERTMEMVPDVDLGADFAGGLGLAAAWVVLMLREDWRRQPTEHEEQLQECKKVLDAFIGGEYGPLVDFAEWQAGVSLWPEMMNELSQKLRGNGGIGQKWEKSSTELCYEFWRMVADRGVDF